MKPVEFKTFVMKELSTAARSLGDPKRLQILELISQCPRSVSELSRFIRASMAATSHHLQILKRARVALERRQGKRIYYSITPFGGDLWRVLSESSERYLPQIQAVVKDFFADEEHSALNAAELKERIRSGRTILIDVRPTEEYEFAHFPGAVSMPLKKIEDTMKRIPAGREVVAYCRGPYCVLSREAANLLKKHGILARRFRQAVAGKREINESGHRNFIR